MRNKTTVAAFVFLSLLFLPEHVLAQKMKVGYWTSGFSLGFGAVMEQMRFAENQGLNIEWVKFAEVNGPTRAIVSNAIDIAFAAPSTNSMGIAADGGAGKNRARDANRRSANRRAGRVAR